jgi:hypothetical protein
LQNVTTASGEFSLEYAAGTSKMIASGADMLSRLLDRGLHPEGDDWNTCDSYRDYPGIQMIYAHLDKQMDDRGRIIAALQLDGEDQHGLHNNTYADSAYIPDDIWQIDGQRLAPGVHPGGNEA